MTGNMGLNIFLKNVETTQNQSLWSVVLHFVFFHHQDIDIQGKKIITQNNAYHLFFKHRFFILVKITEKLKYNPKKYVSVEEYYKANLQMVKAMNRAKAEFIKKLKEKDQLKYYML